MQHGAEPASRRSVLVPPGGPGLRTGPRVWTQARPRAVRGSDAAGREAVVAGAPLGTGGRSPAGDSHRLSLGRISLSCFESWDLALHTPPHPIKGRKTITFNKYGVDQQT